MRLEGVKLMRGVYGEPDGSGQMPPTSKVKAALAVSPAGSQATGVTALAMAGAALPDLAAAEAQERIHVLVPGGQAHRPRRPEIVVHQRVPHCPGLIYRPTGILTTSLTHAWVDAVRHLGRSTGWAPPAPVPAPARGLFTQGPSQVLLNAVQLGDALVRRDRPKIHLADLATCVQATRGPGSKLVHAAFALVRPRADSLMETWLRLILWAAGFPDPAINHELWIGDHHFFLDLAWPGIKVAVEYQGRQHFRDEQQAYHDMVRRGVLQQNGWTVIEVAHKDLLNPSDLLGRLAQAHRW